LSQGAGQSLNAPQTNLTKGFTKKLTKKLFLTAASGPVGSAYQLSQNYSSIYQSGF